MQRDSLLESLRLLMLSLEPHKLDSLERDVIYRTYDDFRCHIQGWEDSSLLDVYQEYTQRMIRMAQPKKVTV